MRIVSSSISSRSVSTTAARSVSFHTFSQHGMKHSGVGRSQTPIFVTIP